MAEIVDFATRLSAPVSVPPADEAATVPTDRPQGLVDLLAMVQTWRDGSMPVPGVWVLVGVCAGGEMSVYGSSDRPILELVGLLTAGVSSLTTIATTGR